MTPKASKGNPTHMNTTAKSFAVNLWGSHPDEGNDDCHTGTDFDTLEQAEKAFDETLPPTRYYVAFVELEGPPGVRRCVRPNPGYDAKRLARESAQDDADERREQAMQAGMGLGVEAYNEAMGY